MSDEIRDTKDDRASKLAWFLTGTVIGAMAALLYAPKAGKETRRLISDRTQRSKDAVTDTTESIVEAGRDMFERGRKLVEEAADLFERGRRLVRG